MRRQMERRRSHAPIREPSDRVMFVLTTLEFAASRAGRDGCLPVPDHVLEEWGRVLRDAWAEMDPRERAVRRLYLEDYRTLAEHRDGRLDADEALAFLDG